MNKIEVGAEFAPKSFLINRKLLVEYADASGDQNPIHQDEAFAKSVGLPDVIAHGMLTMALAGKYVSDISGSQSVLEFSARFIKPVVVPADTDVALVISGKVTEVNNGIAKIELLAMCNEVKVLGMAKGVIKI
ncbi:MAG: MaoC/PaaZ C-terminal domain-containing protein [Actinobacteria bacterium]|jgi:acyl dehydratase|nr:MaoC/PaaZ C-terminal domain-containing protein [Actinomycetota bacterium]MDA2981479.1 MaoC/PaaZ C-terminal domain-containing protein [Actinomycetota bacterium]MDA2995978.1 MaoC/PaaZ C-terminal domain-containing protein [Actinomycetota bacterium]